MKLSKSSQTRLKNKLNRAGKEIEVKEDGTVFFYESVAHKSKLDLREARKLERAEARRAERIAERKAARRAK